MPLYLSFIFMITHHLPSISIMTFHLRSIFMTTRHLIGGVQYMTMAQGVDSNAATITGPNGQQQPAYYVQQPVYLDQNGQPVYYRVGTFSLSLSLSISLSLSLSLSLCFSPSLSPLLALSLSASRPLSLSLCFSPPLFLPVPTFPLSIKSILISIPSCYTLIFHPLSFRLFILPANQNGQYQQQDGPMIYGVPTQQEGGNPLGDPLQVSYVPYNPTQSQAMGNQTGYWAPQSQGKSCWFILQLSLFIHLLIHLFNHLYK